LIYFLSINYHSTELIRALLNSILETRVLLFKLVIVNNSPQENILSSLSNYSVNLHVITPGINIGFGRGCNLGIEYIYNIDSNARIWLINPDATIDRSAISYISKCFEHDNSIAILGTKIRDTQGLIWFGKGHFNRFVGTLDHRYKEREKSSTATAIENCCWVSGCSMIINLAVFEHCPTFDTHYFLYCEDTDFCIRYHQKGYHIAVTQAALVDHDVSAITNRNKISKFKHYTFSKLYFLYQHAFFVTFVFHVFLTFLKLFINFFVDRDIAHGQWQGLKLFILYIVSEAW
jgi:GT2 family glycosyltransferase